MPSLALLTDLYELTMAYAWWRTGKHREVPLFRGGKRVVELPSIGEIREHRARELARFHAGVKRFENPHRYPVGLEKNLFDMKTKLIMDVRAAN